MKSPKNISSIALVSFISALLIADVLAAPANEVNPIASQKSVATDATLSVTVNPVLSNDGNVIYSVYSDDASYTAEKGPVKEGKIAAKQGSDSFSVTGLQPGFYALTVFHDANNNGKLDTNFLGQPKEEFGISNISRTLWSKPKWDEVKFEVKAGQKNELAVVLKMQ